MAKGVEDNAFYRYTRLVSLTEVGAEPSEFAVSVDEFHRRQEERLRVLPESMTTLSTHDTKRSEDTRARIHVLAELPDAWKRFMHEVHARVPLGDGSLENGLWQSIVGAWPASRERLHDYALKAAREAGASTDVDRRPTRSSRSGCSRWSTPPSTTSACAPKSRRWPRASRRPGCERPRRRSSLQLMMPGMPDVYQGSERWERSLVDPDNRRPVEFDVAAGLLRAPRRRAGSPRWTRRVRRRCS